MGWDLTTFYDYGFDLSLSVFQLITIYASLFIAIGCAFYLGKVWPFIKKNKYQFSYKLFFAFLGYFFLGGVLLKCLAMIYYFRILNLEFGGVLGIPYPIILISEIIGICVGYFVIRIRIKRRVIATHENKKESLGKKIFIFLIAMIFPGMGFIIRSQHLLGGLAISLQILFFLYFPFFFGSLFYCIIEILQIWFPEIKNWISKFKYRKEARNQSI